MRKKEVSGQVIGQMPLPPYGSSGSLRGQSLVRSPESSFVGSSAASVVSVASSGRAPSRAGSRGVPVVPELETQRGTPPRSYVATPPAGQMAEGERAAGRGMAIPGFVLSASNERLI